MTAADKEIDEAERRQVEAEFLQHMEDEMRRVTVEEYLLHLLPVLSSMAFQRMGVTAETSADRDLAQSRLAIDAFGAVSEVLQGVRPAEENQVYRSTLHQMRMAYVAVTAHAGEPPAEDGAAERSQPGPAEDERPVGTDEGPAAEGEGAAAEHEGAADGEVGSGQDDGPGDETLEE